MGFGRVVFVGLVMFAIAAAVWFTTRPGKNQVLIRTCVCLTLMCLWLMWGVTYLAQLHPLVAPRRGDLRAEIN